MKRTLITISLIIQTSPFLSAVPLEECRVEPFAPVPAEIQGPEQPVKAMEARAPELAGAANLGRLLKEKLGVKLPDEGRAFLAKNGFVLLDLQPTRLATRYPPMDPDAEHDYRSTSDEMLAAFDGLGGGEREDTSWHPKLVTPDLFLHAYHRYFSHSLEFIEQHQLRPRLESFLDAVMKNAAELRPQTDARTAARIEWVEAQLATAWIVLGNETAAPAPGNDDGEEVMEDGNQAQPKTDPRTVRQRLDSVRNRFSDSVMAAVRKEVDLILEAKSQEPSPLFSCYDKTRPTDYTQFIPRSHYTKTQELRGWFRSMMFLGLTGQTLPGDDDLGLTDALLASQILARQPAKGARPLDAWRDLMEITTFFAGRSDDLDYPVLRDWVAKTLGGANLKLASATDPEVLRKLTEAIRTLPQPRIVSGPHPAETNSPAVDKPSFRIFGQRFSADAWILSTLTRDSPDRAPSMPSATFVTAAFGDDFSWNRARDFVRPDHQALFNQRIEALRKQISGMPDSTWFVSMAGAQLKTAASLCGPRGANYPHYMQSPFFAAKNAESVLGSWTELKHDTVLYAKQAYAEMGEGGNDDQPIPPLTRGFVQPDVRFWRSMERLAEFTATGFQKHKLLPDAAEEYSTLNEFLRQVRFCRMFAEKEIQCVEIDRADYDKLDLMSLRYMDQSLDYNAESGPENGQAALVTDVFTDAGSGQALHEALGRPCLMLALVGDKPHTRIVTGLAYQHLEFTRSMDSRMTDEEWKKAVYQTSAGLPGRAKWAAPVFKPVPCAEAP